jgi:hypothetical protein
MSAPDLPPVVASVYRSSDDTTVTVLADDFGGRISIDSAELRSLFYGIKRNAISERHEASYYSPACKIGSNFELMYDAYKNASDPTEPILFVISTCLNSELIEANLIKCIRSIQLHEPTACIHVLYEPLRCDRDCLDRLRVLFSEHDQIRWISAVDISDSIGREPKGLSHAMCEMLASFSYSVAIFIHDNVKLHRKLPNAVLASCPIVPLWVFRWPMHACDSDALEYWCRHEFSGIDMKKSETRTGIFGLMMSMNREGARRLAATGFPQFVDKICGQVGSLCREPGESDISSIEVKGFTRMLAMSAERLVGYILEDLCDVKPALWSMQGRSWRIRGLDAGLTEAPDTDDSRESFWFTKSFNGR